MHVPGDGPTPCRVCFVGEAPGYWESQPQLGYPSGRPFVGKSGKELDTFMRLGGLTRENVYVTNLCKYQPPYINGKQQPPSKEDIERDTPELVQELLATRPRWIGAVGRYAARWLTGLDLSMEEAHGLAYPLGKRIQKLVAAAAITDEPDTARPVSWMDRCRIVPIYHPASALHNTELAPLVWWDLQQFGKYVLGRLQPPTTVDEFPSPDYDVYTDSMRRPDGTWIGSDIRSLFATDPEWVAIDTEGLLPPHGTPWGLSISTAPGMARVISVNDVEQLALLNELLANSNCWIILHNALHDVPILEVMGVSIPWARVQDTLLMLFTLRLLALGLKPTSRRLSGMTMQAYTDVIRPAERSIALAYIQRATSARVCTVCNGTGKVAAYGKVKSKELRRLVTCKQQPHDVYIGRPSEFGNPFVIGKDGTRAEVIAKYRDWFLAQPEMVAKARATLVGKVLACWCAPQPCHGDVLAEIANGALLKRLDKCQHCVDGGLWPEREGQLKWDWTEARWKTTKGWEIGRYLRKLREDIEAGYFEQLTGDDDTEDEHGQEHAPKTIRERWESWDDDVREPVEELIGEMPQATLDQIPFNDAMRYSAADADSTGRNYPKIRAMVDDMELYDAYRLDLAVIPAAAEMQRNGMKINRDGFEKLSRRLRRENDLIATELRQLTGRSINPASGDQVAGYLFGERKLEFNELDERELTAAWSLNLESEKKTKTGKRAATDDKTLNGLLLKYADRPEVTRPVQLFLDHRTRHKLDTGYVIKMPLYTDANDRVHPRVKPTTAATFRWCIARGTPIDVLRDVAEFPAGVPIEQVRAGDTAYSFDGRGKLVLRRIVSAAKTGHRRVLRIHWKAHASRSGYLDCTPEHEIRTVKRGWVRADQLRPNDRVYALARGIDREGYARLYPTGAPMIAREHRFVLRASADRTVHHRNRNKLDNRLENLELLSNLDHVLHHAAERAVSHPGRRRLRTGPPRPRRNYTREFLVDLLRKHGGKPRLASRSIRADSTSFQQSLTKHGIDWHAIRAEYTADGRKITEGLVAEGRRVHAAAGQYAALKFMCMGYYKWSEAQRRYGWIPRNHIVTFVEVLPRAVDVYDVEVEGTHNFIAGEICVHNSMADPPLQTIPIRAKGGADLGKLVRQCFVAEEGYVLGSADFDQVELRDLAALSGDSDLIRAFREGLDPHVLGAAKIWRIPYAELYTRYKAKEKKAMDMRTSAKNINFGIVYGVTARGLKAQMDLRGEVWTIDECQDLIDTYLRTLFPGIGAFLVDAQDEARRHGYVRSEMGHVRYLPGVWSSVPSIRAEAERQAANFKIQCVPGDVRVRTSTGFTRMSDFVDGTRVWTGETWASAERLDRGSQSIVEVVTNDGAMVRCTADHKFSVLRSAWPEWVRASDLVKDDVLATSQVVDELGQVGKEVEDAEFWYWVGRYYGDGNLIDRGSGHKKQTYVCWTFGAGVKETEIDRLCAYISARGWHPCVVKSRRFKRDGSETFVYTVSTRQMSRLMMKYGIETNQVAGTKRLANIVFELDSTRRKALFDGYYDADGTRNRGSAKGTELEKQLTSINLPLMRDTQLLLRSLGVSSVILGPYAQKDKRHKQFYRLTVRARLEMRRVSEVIDTGFVERVFTLTVDDPRHAYDSEGLVSKNCHSAELLKAAVRDIWERGKRTLDEVGAKLLLSLHDEVVFECPDTEYAKSVAASVVETYMTNPLPLAHGVQITAAVKYASNWGDLKDAEDWQAAT